MKLLTQIFSNSRVKDARRRLAEDGSAKNYVALALEHARLGEMPEVRRLCEEALVQFPGHTELLRLAERARAVQAESRTRHLMQELQDSPRPALYRELAELFLDGGRLERAEETAATWYTATSDPAALLVRARVRMQRFRDDKRREDARQCLEFLETVEKAMPRDERPLRLRLELLCAVGAWRDARKSVGQLLELFPGDTALEARFRTYNGLADRAPTVDAALREIERTGQLAAEAGAHKSSAATGGALRPMLQALAAQVHVLAAVFERGATALVQGQKGATAERNARASREIVSKSRTTARRLGLGATQEIELEGDQGSVLILSVDQGSASVFSSQTRLPSSLREALLEISGADARADAERGAA